MKRRTESTATQVMYRRFGARDPKEPRRISQQEEVQMKLLHPAHLAQYMLVLVIVVLLTACGGGKQAAPAAKPTQPPAPVKAAEPTAVPAVAGPTAAPGATEAPAPTEAPVPTETSEPAPTAEPTEVPPTEPPAAEAPTGQAGIDLLLDAMRAQLSQQAFRMNMTTEDGGKTTTMVMEYVAPNSFHSTTEKSEFILVDGASYMKGADGKWEKSPMDLSGMVSQILSPELVDEMAKNITVEKMRFVGPDLIDGKPMWVYQYETTMELMGQKINSRATVWLGVLDKLPYRQESEGDSVVNKGSRTKTEIVYEYDSGITIEAPIP